MTFILGSENMSGSFFDDLMGKDKKETLINDEIEQEQLRMLDFNMLGNKEEDKIRGLQKKELKELKNKVSSELANKTTNKKLFGTTDKKELDWLVKTIKGIIEHHGTKLSRTMQKSLVKEMVLEITSLGKIHDLIIDPTISEIMINGYDEVWIERKGKQMLTNIKFNDEEEVRELAIKIVNNVGRSITNSNPIVDARLPDGSRVNIVLFPTAMKGTTITIRKFFKEKLTIKDLIKFNSINEEAAEFLRKLVESRANIIVSGGTGTGKTTTLNIVSNFVPDGERILTIEDSAELQLNNAHVVKLESKDANAEGKGKISIHDLVVTSLRMYPHRIIVGEVRDGTAFELLQALNTGHDGSMTTVHANNASGCITRLESMVLMAGVDMPSRAIRKNIADAVDVIVQIKKMGDGSRKIYSITEVVGYDEGNNIVTIKDIYRFKKKGIDEDGTVKGELEFTGHIVNETLQEKFELSNLNYFEAVGLEPPTVNN